jgi:hypothetical protein
LDKGKMMKSKNMYFAISAILIIGGALSEYNEGPTTVLMQFLMLSVVWILGVLSYNSIVEQREKIKDEDSTDFGQNFQ